MTSWDSSLYFQSTNASPPSLFPISIFVFSHLITILSSVNIQVCWFWSRPEGYRVWGWLSSAFLAVSDPPRYPHPPGPALRGRKPSLAGHISHASHKQTRQKASCTVVRGKALGPSAIIPKETGPGAGRQLSLQTGAYPLELDWVSLFLLNSWPFIRGDR